jgi:hypothetical protein
MVVVCGERVELLVDGVITILRGEVVPQIMRLLVVLSTWDERREKGSAKTPSQVADHIVL